MNGSEIMNSPKGVKSGVSEEWAFSCPKCDTRHDSYQSKRNAMWGAGYERVVQLNEEYIVIKTQNMVHFTDHGNSGFSSVCHIISKLTNQITQSHLYILKCLFFCYKASHNPNFAEYLGAAVNRSNVSVCHKMKHHVSINRLSLPQYTILVQIILSNQIALSYYKYVVLLSYK